MTWAGFTIVIGILELVAYVLLVRFDTFDNDSRVQNLLLHLNQKSLDILPSRRLIPVMVRHSVVNHTACAE